MTRFNDVLIESLTDTPPKTKWFYVAFRDEETGVFSFAAIVEDRDSIKASLKASQLYDMKESIELARYVEIPPEKLPDASYRNRKLTRVEVETLLGER